MTVGRLTGPATLVAAALMTAGLWAAVDIDRLLAGSVLLAAGSLIGLAFGARRAYLTVRDHPRAAAAVGAVAVVAVGAQLAAGAITALFAHASSIPRLLLTVLPAGVAGVGAATGLVLLAEEARLNVAAHPDARPWDLLIGARHRRRWSLTYRSVAGIALLLAAGVFAILLTGTYLRGHVVAEVVLGAVIAVSVIGTALTPIAVAVVGAADRARLQESRDRERERLAAELHDSVLQTLALLTRHVDDPVMVGRLARRQERELRQWMAGVGGSSAPTVAAAVREMVDGEAESAPSLIVTGDCALTDATRALVAAAREALRNAARHAPGCTVHVLVRITSTEITAFVRDDGPGFDPAAVPAERRGIRDSIDRRMRNAGGSATIDSAPGQGTEIVLQVPRQP